MATDQCRERIAGFICDNRRPKGVTASQFPAVEISEKELELDPYLQPGADAEYELKGRGETEDGYPLLRNRVKVCDARSCVCARICLRLVECV